MIWGVKKPEVSEGSSVFGTARAGSLEWDREFEMGDEKIQRAVLDQVRTHGIWLHLVASRLIMHDEAR